jgi:hypothetical protein
MCFFARRYVLFCVVIIASHSLITFFNGIMYDAMLYELQLPKPPKLKIVHNTPTLQVDIFRKLTVQTLSDATAHTIFLPDRVFMIKCHGMSREQVNTS